MERRTTVHRNGFARVVSQDKDRSVIRRIVAPPSLPLVIQPRSPDRAAHVATEDPGSDVTGSAPDNAAAGARRPARAAPNDPLERARAERPVMERRSPDAQQVREALIRPRAVTVQRDAETLHA